MPAARSDHEGCCELPPQRAHVTLTQDAEYSQASERFIVVGHRVREDVAHTSDLLSGLAQADGLASLPDDLSPHEVQLWQAAKLRGVLPSTDELLTILKVADVLGDNDLATWVDLLAQRIVRTRWADQKTAEAMLAALLTTPPHLLHRCLVACVPQWSSLPDLLESLPLPLHHPLLAAWAAEGALEVSVAIDHSFLVLLSTTTIPQPGLQNLTFTPLSKDVCITPSLAALLARTLAAHPSLTKLNVSGFTFTAPALELFAAGLMRGALPQLANLSISTQEHPGGSAALLGCLRKLRTLTHLQVLAEPEDSVDIPRLASLARCEALPVRFPSLVSLEVTTVLETDEDEAEAEGAGEAVEEETEEEEIEETAESGAGSWGEGTMRMFTAPGGRSSFIPSFLPFIGAPALTRLCLATNVRQMSFSHLWAALAHLSSLRELSLYAEMRDQPSCLPQPSGAGVMMPVLCSIHITSSCPVSPHYLAAFSAKYVPNVTSLVLWGGARQRFARRCTVRQVKRAWATLLPAIGRCTKLQRLALGVLCGVHTGAHVLRHSTHLAAVLKPLVALTRLDLRATEELVLEDSHCRLYGKPLGGALKELTALEALRFCSGDGKLEIQEAQHVLDASTGLSKLTQLGLCIHTEQEVQLSAVIPKLPELKELLVGGSMLNGVDGIETLQARFSKLTSAKCNCKPARAPEA